MDRGRRQSPILVNEVGVEVDEVVQDRDGQPGGVYQQGKYGPPGGMTIKNRVEISGGPKLRRI